MRLKNEENRRSTARVKITDVTRSKLRWSGHVVRKGEGKE